MYVCVCINCVFYFSLSTLRNFVETHIIETPARISLTTICIDCVQAYKIAKNQCGKTASAARVRRRSCNSERYLEHLHNRENEN